MTPTVLGLAAARKYDQTQRDLATTGTGDLQRVQAGFAGHPTTTGTDL